MRRGEIRLVDFEPVLGSEANKRRPAVIVSNDRGNTAALTYGRGVITVIPLTTNVAQVYPFQTLLEADTTGLTRDSKAQAEQIRSVALERLGPVIGRLPAAEMVRLEEALRHHLQL